jgi:hypothetical protein
VGGYFLREGNCSFSEEKEPKRLLFLGAWFGQLALANAVGLLVCGVESLGGGLPRCYAIARWRWRFSISVWTVL